MEIKNRLFPYPVLCIENDDYINCEFNIKFNQFEELKEIVLQFEVELNNNELLEKLLEIMVKNLNIEFQKQRLIKKYF